jgi:GNAT superfamily N-acetyltransferase
MFGCLDVPCREHDFKKYPACFSALLALPTRGYPRRMPHEPLQVVDVVASALLSEGQRLVFEYMAQTQAENGMPVPTVVADLPGGLRTECADLATAYRYPGVLLLARHADESVGCVGVQPMSVGHTAEVKRLYVRPGARRRGVARALMAAAHEHARAVGFIRLVLDVMPARVHALAFYRSLGYTPTDALVDWPMPMVWLGRDIGP